MVGRCISYWNSPILGDMLVFRGVRISINQPGFLLDGMSAKGLVSLRRCSKLLGPGAGEGGAHPLPISSLWMIWVWGGCRCLGFSSGDDHLAANLGFRVVVIYRGYLRDTCQRISFFSVYPIPCILYDLRLVQYRQAWKLHMKPNWWDGHNFTSYTEIVVSHSHSSKDWCPPPKTNMELENHLFAKWTYPFPNLHFWVPCWFLWV